MHKSLHLVLDHTPGVQLRIAMVLTRRGFWMDSLSLFPIAGSRFQRLMLTVTGPADGFDQLCKQLAKLVEVRRVDALLAEVSHEAECDDVVDFDDLAREVAS